MYESYWQLARKPFENCSDPQFYFPSESHQAALLKLRYAIENHRGAALLTGPCGSGKTLLVTMLRAMLGETFTPFVHVVFPPMDAPQLLSYLAAELVGSSEVSSQSVAQNIRLIEGFLAENTQRGKHAVLSIDESHLLDDPKTLEALRLLLNFELAGRPGLTLLLAGQPGILPLLDRTPQLEERLGVKCLLRPFGVAETAQYVEHRLRAAGGKKAIFDPSSWPVAHRLTNGIARRINRLGDLALLIGYAEQRASIEGEQLESVYHELVAVVPE